LLHIRDGEQWWLENWTHGPAREFPKLPQTTAIVEAQELFRETAHGRNGYMVRLLDCDLDRRVTVWVTPARQLSFTLGESMLQVCSHGTHHRAQAVNMLRHAGAAKPELDYAEWFALRGSAYKK
jgi:uncharacterized damage-inducible protein DinB